MKPIRWTAHAKKKARLRDIDRQEAEVTVSHPDQVSSGRTPRKIYMRRYFDATLKVDMLLRVVVEETLEDLVIVTVYKTSRFQKYARGNRHES
jgi:hypothetical protein